MTLVLHAGWESDAAQATARVEVVALHLWGGGSNGGHIFVLFISVSFILSFTFLVLNFGIELYILLRIK